MASPDIKVQFGTRVRQLRTARGWSQEGFAHHIGMDRSYYGSVERGLRNVSLENIAAIAAGLEVLPAELLMFDRPSPAATGTEAESKPAGQAGAGES
jgi:transcriptional regulator with XRE-family HTH domain